MLETAKLYPGLRRTTQVKHEIPPERYRCNTGFLISESIFSGCEPSNTFTYKLAMEIDEKRAWNTVMKEQFKYLENMQRWKLVKLPKDKSFVKTKSIYDIKRDAYGNMEL